MSVEINSNEIDVLHYLSANPELSSKEILQGVKLIPSLAAIHNILNRLTTLGLLNQKNGVIYSLSELGLCLIGKSTPSDFLAKEMRRRKLPEAPLLRINDYPWGERVQSFTSVVMSRSHQAVKSPSKKTLVTKSKGKSVEPGMPWRDGKKRSNIQVPIEHPEKPSEVVHLPASAYKPSPVDVGEVASKPKSTPVKKASPKASVTSISKDRSDGNQYGNNRPTVNKELTDMSKTETNIIYFFSESERALLTDLQNGVTRTFDKGKLPEVTALASRRIIADKSGVCELTRLGRKVLSKEGLLAFTPKLNLTKPERLLFEIIAHGDPFMIRTAHGKEVLAAHGLPASANDVRDIIAKLKEKGLMLTRSNKMSYFEVGAVGLAGLTKVTPRVRGKMLAVPGVDEAFIASLESDNSEVLAIAEELRTKPKTPTKADKQAKPKVTKVDAGALEEASTSTPISEAKQETSSEKVESQPVSDSPSESEQLQIDVEPTSAVPAKPAQDADKITPDAQGNVVWMKELQAKREQMQKPEPAEIANKDEKVKFLMALSENFFPEEGSTAAAMLNDIVNDYQAL